MSDAILVAYATKHGSTKEVAEAVAATLGEHGADVDVRPAADVADVSLFDAVVLGGALYMGRWHRDAVRFLQRHRDHLAEVPLAIFAMGPLTLEEKDVAGSRAQLDRALARTPELEPVDVAIFGGVVNPAELHFPFSKMSPSDARDWDAIRAWSEHLAPALAKHSIAVHT